MVVATTEPLALTAFALENEPPGGMPILVMDWADALETNVINPAAAARHLTGVGRTTQMGE
jgi:hypothetical protein